MKNRNFLDDLKKFFFSNNALSRIILANTVLFLLYLTLSLYLQAFLIPMDVYGGITGFAYWLGLPSDIAVLLQHPWSIVTFMFYHESFWQLLFNMITFYFSGKIFMQYFGDKKLLFTYFLGGISGAALYIISYSAFPIFSAIKPISFEISASASMLAVMTATAFYVPDLTVRVFNLFNVRLKYIALIFVFLDILYIPENNPGTYMVHIGGILCGFVYIVVNKKQFLDSVTNPISKFLKNLFRPKPKLRVEHKQGRPVTDDEYNRIRNEKQKRMDAILDKISKSGYDSLSREEKEFLFSGNKK